MQSLQYRAFPRAINAKLKTRRERQIIMNLTQCLHLRPKRRHTGKVLPGQDAHFFIANLSIKSIANFNFHPAHLYSPVFKFSALSSSGHLRHVDKSFL